MNEKEISKLRMKSAAETVRRALGCGYLLRVINNETGDPTIVLCEPGDENPDEGEFIQNVSEMDNVTVTENEW